MSLRRPPGARARARDQGRSEEIMAELAHMRRFLNRATSIDVSLCVYVCVYLCVCECVLWSHVYACVCTGLVALSPQFCC